MNKPESGAVNKKPVTNTVWIVVALAIMALIYFIDPEEIHFYSCPFKIKTGLSCPTCGLSRSLHSISRLRIRDSLSFHPLGTVLFPVIIMWLVKSIIELPGKKKLKNPIPQNLKKPLLYSLFIFWLFFWLFRLSNEI